MGERRSAVRALIRGGEGTIAAAIVAMNLATYAFTIVAARALGPQPYGALAALMATLLVLGVAQLGLQATAARRIAADPSRVAQIERSVLSVTYRGSALLGLVVLLASPILSVVLRIDSILTCALVAAAVVPLTIMGGQAGILQGERRWGGLALLYLASGIPRLLVGSALLWWRPSEASAMLGVVLGALVPVAVGLVLLRPVRDVGTDSEDHALAHVTAESLRNSQALLAFFALSSADVIVARNVMSPHQAGLYAAGLILTKAVLFLPQFVVVVAFPAMSTPEERRTALLSSLGLIAVIGVAATIGAWLFQGLALVFIGGAQYAEIQDYLWGFAVLGTLLSMLQLLVYSVMARQGRKSVFLVWAALVSMILMGPFAHTPPQLLVVVGSVDATLLVALLAINLSQRKTPARPDPSPASPA